MSKSPEKTNRQNAFWMDRGKQPAMETVVQSRPLLAGTTKNRVSKGKGTFVERDLFESDAFWALTDAAPQMLSVRD